MILYFINKLTHGLFIEFCNYIKYSSKYSYTCIFIHPSPLNYLFVADFKMELTELIGSNTSLPDPIAKSPNTELEASVKSNYSTD